MKSVLMVSGFLALLTACGASGRGPIVDMQGVSAAQYAQDLAECRDYADQVQVGREVVQGAVGGAVVGGAVGAAVGDSDTAQRAAGVGAVGGAARGVGNAVREREQVVRNCLLGRGYRVLN